MNRWTNFKNVGHFGNWRCLAFRCYVTYFEISKWPKTPPLPLRRGGSDIFVGQKIKLVLNDSPAFLEYTTFYRIEKYWFFVKLRIFLWRCVWQKSGFRNTNYIGKIAHFWQKLAHFKLFFCPKHIKTKFCLSFSWIRWIKNIFHWNIDDDSWFVRILNDFIGKFLDFYL